MTEEQRTRIELERMGYSGGQAKNMARGGIMQQEVTTAVTWYKLQEKET